MNQFQKIYENNIFFIVCWNWDDAGTFEMFPHERQGLLYATVNTTAADDLWPILTRKLTCD